VAWSVTLAPPGPKARWVRLRPSRRNGPVDQAKTAAWRGARPRRRARAPAAPGLSGRLVEVVQLVGSVRVEPAQPRRGLGRGDAPRRDQDDGGQVEGCEIASTADPEPRRLGRGQGGPAGRDRQHLAPHDRLTGLVGVDQTSVAAQQIVHDPPSQRGQGVGRQVGGAQSALRRIQRQAPDPPDDAVRSVQEGRFRGQRRNLAQGRRQAKAKPLGRRRLGRKGAERQDQEPSRAHHRPGLKFIAPHVG
jgi:hypothetical protein